METCLRKAKPKLTKYAPILISVVAFGLLIFFGYKTREVPDQVAEGENYKVKIATSIYPLYYLSKTIGGEFVQVTNITPPGAEPHDYELTTQDIATINSSGLLVYTGMVEPWSAKVSENILSSNVKQLDLSGIITDKNDPHFWLSPKLLSAAADLVTQSLIKIDAANAEKYLTNASGLNNRLLELDTKYRTGLSNCVTRDLVTSHEAFGYLANEYNLQQVGIAGISTEEEPSLKKLASIADFARKNNVTYIFFESLLSPKIAETIAKEVGAKTLVLNPLEGLSTQEVEAGSDYISIMEDNLQNLKTALQCQ